MGRPRITKQTGQHIDSSQGKLGELVRSDYSATYIKHKNYAAERQIVKPHVAAIADRIQYPAMDLQTTNMRTYKSHGHRCRREMIRPRERELATGEFNRDTEYTDAYQRKFAKRPALASAPENRSTVEAKPKFTGDTTNKEFFTGTEKLPTTERFGELPTFTHSLLFPDKANLKELLRSRTQLDFPYKTTQKPDLVKAASPNIKVGQGDHDLLTTQRECFKYVPSFPKIHSKSAKVPHNRPMSLPKIELTTKYNDDFPKRKRSKPRKLIAPAPETLQIKMDNKYRVATEQRDQFHGWDVKKHKRPEAAKLPDNTQHCDEPMSSETTTQHDYVPKHHDSKTPVAKLAETYEPNPAKLDAVTTNKRFYRDWGTTRRLRHGDFHEACNEAHNFTKVGVPEPMPKSTTRDAFVEKAGRPRTTMKPDYTTIDSSQTHDFNTIAKMAYKIPPASAYIPEDFVVRC